MSSTTIPPLACNLNVKDNYSFSCMQLKRQVQVLALLLFSLVCHWHIKYNTKYSYSFLSTATETSSTTPSTDFPSSSRIPFTCQVQHLTPSLLLPLVCHWSVKKSTWHGFPLCATKLSSATPSPVSPPSCVPMEPDVPMKPGVQHLALALLLPLMYHWSSQ